MLAMARVYLGVGSNLGNRLQNLREALQRCETHLHITRVSSIYDTAPWGISAQPRFLNIVAQGETALQPHALLAFVKTIEAEMGRASTARYGPRVIDLDILLYDDLIFHDAKLQIPHPRLAERRFVLTPLAELEPDLLHPQLEQTVSDLLTPLQDVGDVNFLMAWE